MQSEDYTICDDLVTKYYKKRRNKIGIQLKTEVHIQSLFLTMAEEDSQTEVYKRVNLVTEVLSEKQVPLFKNGSKVSLLNL